MTNSNTPESWSAVGLGILLGAGIAGLALRLPTHSAGRVEIAGYALLILAGAGGLLYQLIRSGKIRFGKRKAEPEAEEPPLPPVHSLVTLSHGKEGAESSIGFGGPGSVLSLHTEVDAILYQRLDEYKLHRTDEGCVLILTETIPAGASAIAGAPHMNGATAILSLARAVAEVRGKPTMLIDTGSSAWSVYQVKSEDSYAPDIIPLPPVPGVYEVIAGKHAIDEWLLMEDEISSLSALAPGQIPSDWAEQLRSSGMRRLLTAARAVADVVFVYAPRVNEYPEVISALNEWSNGLMIISAAAIPGATAENSSAEDGEMRARTTLNEMGTLILGRIALDLASAGASARPLTPLSDDETRAAAMIAATPEQSTAAANQ